MTETPIDADTLVGTLLGGYLVEKRLGSGGMGMVFLAEDRHLQRKVALKLLKPELYADTQMRKRFEKEAASAAGIEHEHVVRIYSIDIDPDGRPYIVMEYVDGPDLSAIVQAESIAPERALRIFAQVAGALQAVHEQGLVHRDVKPANVLIRHAGSADECAMLTDFGIAKAVDSQTAMTFGVIGTAEYMSPEVADLQGATDRSDQYALGAVLYRMLCGERLFEGMEMPKAHRDEPLPDLSLALPAANRALRAALARSLEKDPVERFPSVAAFAKAVRESQDTAATAARPPLQKAMEQALGERGPLLPSDLAAAVNERLGADDSGFTELQVDGRARLYSQLFHRRPDGRIELRGR